MRFHHLVLHEVYHLYGVYRRPNSNMLNMAAGERLESLHLNYDDEIKKFLDIADLQSVEPALREEGVTKIGHITDVTAEDLTKLGM